MKDLGLAKNHFWFLAFFLASFYFEIDEKEKFIPVEKWTWGSQIDGINRRPSVFKQLTV